MALSKSEIEAYKKAFDLFDKNKDGRINKEELRNVMKQVGKDPSDEELKGKILNCKFQLEAQNQIFVTRM